MAIRPMTLGDGYPRHASVLFRGFFDGLGFRLGGVAARVSLHTFKNGVRGTAGRDKVGGHMCT